MNNDYRDMRNNSCYISQEEHVESSEPQEEETRSEPNLVETKIHV